jgi:hypothetical protein
VVFRGQAMGKPIAAAYKAVAVADASDPKPEIKEHLKQILSAIGACFLVTNCTMHTTKERALLPQLPSRSSSQQGGKDEQQPRNRLRRAGNPPSGMQTEGALFPQQGPQSKPVRHQCPFRSKEGAAGGG